MNENSKEYKDYEKIFELSSCFKRPMIIYTGKKCFFLNEIQKKILEQIFNWCSDKKYLV